MSVTLVAGPGGCGSTTVAAVLAGSLAARRAETVLITTAPTLPEEPVLADSSWLTVVRPEVRAFVEQHAQTAGEVGVPPREIAALPGVELLATLAAVADVLRSNPSAELVIDGGARAVELVGVLERLGRFTDALVPQALRILGRVTGRSSGGGLAVWDGVLDAALPGATALSSASAVLVLPAEAHRIAGALLLPAQLSLFGIGTRGVIVRSDSAGADTAGADTADAEHSGTAGVGDDGGTSADPGSGSIAISWPVGSPTPDLSALLQHSSQTRAVADDTVVATDDGYAWPLPLSGVRRDQLDLERDEDALLISVGDVVRRVELPSVLQRCRVASARFADGVLTVGFVPDPALWPGWARQPVATGARDE